MGSTIFAGGDPSKVDVSGYSKGDVLAADASGDLQPVAVGTDNYTLTADSAATEGVDWQPGGGGGGGVNTVFGRSGNVTAQSGDYTKAQVGLSNVDNTSDASKPVSTAQATAISAGDAASVATAAADATTKANAAQANAIAAAAADATTKANAAQAAAIAAAATDATTKANAAQAAAILASNKRIVMRQAYLTPGDTALPNTGGSWAALSGFLLQIPAVVGDYVEITVNALRDSNTAFVDVAVLTGVSTLARFMGTGTSTPGSEGNPGWYYNNTFIIARGPQGFVVTAPDLDSGNVNFVIATRSTGVGTLYSSTSYPFYWRAFNYGPVN